MTLRILIAAGLIIFSLLLIVAAVWAFVIWFRCYHETFQMERRWTIVVLVLSGIITSVPFYTMNWLVGLILG